MEKNRSALLIGMVVLAFCMVACAGHFVKNSFRTLAFSQSAYDTTMNTAASLYREGKISADDKARIIEAGNLYYQAHNSAVEALAKYVASDYKDETAKQAYLALAVDVSARLADLIRIAEPYLTKNEGDLSWTKEY